MVIKDPIEKVWQLIVDFLKSLHFLQQKGFRFRHEGGNSEPDDWGKFIIEAMQACSILLAAGVEQVLGLERKELITSTGPGCQRRQ